MDQDDRTRPGFLPDREPSVGSEGNEMEAPDRLHQRIVRDEAGEAEEQRRCLTVGDQQPLGVEDLFLRVDAPRER